MSEHNWGNMSEAGCWSVINYLIQSLCGVFILKIIDHTRSNIRRFYDNALAF